MSVYNREEMLAICLEYLNSLTNVEVQDVLFRADRMFQKLYNPDVRQSKARITELLNESSNEKLEKEFKAIYKWYMNTKLNTLQTHFDELLSEVKEVKV